MKTFHFSRLAIWTLFGGLGLMSMPVFSAENKLSMTGSSTVAPLALEIAKRFESQNSGLRIDVQTGGSGRGIADARNGTADIGLVSRSLKADESDLQGHTIADGKPTRINRRLHHRLSCNPCQARIYLHSW